MDTQNFYMEMIMCEFEDVQPIKMVQNQFEFSEILVRYSK